MEDKKLGYVDLDEWTMFEIGYKWYNWRLYGQGKGFDLTDDDVVRKYLYELGFNDETFGERKKRIKKDIAKKIHEEYLRKESGVT